MSNTSTAPCRLYVLMARQASTAVVFRRGPSHWTQIIRWNTDTDTFEPGAWFRGRLYPERSDISPDGTKLIYLAADFSVRRLTQDFGESWTAVSKAPWLTALAAWKNDMVYFGGGSFETDTMVRVNEPCRDGQFPLVPPPPELTVHFGGYGNNHHLSVLDRLKRLGWELVHANPPASDSPWQEGADAVLRKRASNGSGDMFLGMTSSSPGYTSHDVCTFTLGDETGTKLLPIAGATWADWDRRGRLVYAKEGKLFAVNPATALPGGKDDTLPAVELADFNGYKPHRTRSPDWARKW